MKGNIMMKKNFLAFFLLCLLLLVGASAVYADSSTLDTPIWDSINGPSVVFSPTEIALYWKPSTDNVGVAGYYIYRCEGAHCTLPSQPIFKVNASNASFYADGTVSKGTTYSYAVASYDKAGNISNQSTVISVTTSV